MNKGGENEKIDLVALRKESVDRKIDNVYSLQYDIVALRKESVDRNCTPVYPAAYL